MRVHGKLILLIACALGAAPAAAQPLAERIEAALETLQPTTRVAGRDYPDRSLAELMRRRSVPGVSIAVIEDGRIAWTGAFGVSDGSTTRPVTPETLFQAASISKPVAAMGALALVEQGRLSLDRPVNEQLTSWRVPAHDLGGGPVTLGRLLSHTAGLSVSGFPGYRAGTALPSVVQILNGEAPANTQPVRVTQRPGADFSYSGGGITVAQLLMSDVAGEDFPALLDRLVLRPLAMTRSSFSQPLPADRGTQAAAGHDAAGQPLPGGHHVYPELAAAGLWTTPSDLARFALALGAAYRGEAGAPIRPETARTMLTPVEDGYGLGIGVRGEGEWLRFSHSGSNQGFRAFMTAYPNRRQGIVIMTNGENGAQVATASLQAIGAALGWQDVKPETITPASLPQSVLVERVGRYENASGRAVHVALVGGGLFVIPEQGEQFEIVPQADGTFASPDNGARLRFRVEPATGRVDAILLGSNVLRRTH